MLLPNRHGSSESYRYGFNGKEKDDEIKGEGAQYDYGFRIYDARLARFLSTDPLGGNFPWYTPYQFAGNKPVWKIDIDGLEECDSDANKTTGTTDINNEDEIESYTRLLIFASENGYCSVAESFANKIAQLTGEYKPELTVTDCEETFEGTVKKNSFTQNNANKAHWIGMYNSEGVKKFNCAQAAVEILKMNGQTQSWEKIQFASENSDGTEVILSDSKSIQDGLDYIDTQLSEGNYIKAGVNHTLSADDDKYKKVGKANSDNTTDHWIVITGKHYDKEADKYYYSYYETGTRYKDKGTSDNNRMYINGNGSVRGGSAKTEEPGNSGRYQLTQIRKNNKKNNKKKNTNG